MFNYLHLSKCMWVIMMDQRFLGKVLCKSKLINDRNRPSLATILLALLSLICFWKFYSMPWLFIEYYLKLQSVQDSNHRCVLPNVNPFDPSIKSYVYSPEPINCKKIQPNLVYLNNDGVLFINRTAESISGYHNLDCHYRCFYHNDGIDDDTVKYDEWVKINNSSNIECEFIEVSCKSSFLTVYSYVFSNVKRLKHKNFFKQSNDKLSVIIIGIDAMSRSNMIRKMPKSLHFLETSLGGITFDGYAKIGDNTLPNVIAMLTGLHVYSTKEFPSVLLQTEDVFFDEFANYIWKNFSESGYVTFYAEDRPDIQVFNTGARKGFKNLPTDYYDRPMWLSMWWSFVLRKSSAFCYNSIPEHEFLFEYFRRFIHAYSDDMSFALLWWQNLSHDFLNKIESGDKDFFKFLQYISPYLNKTILFVLSDHGQRYGAIRQTVVGRVESRMPFLNIVTPKWFRVVHPKAYQSLLENSSGRLTTPFDIYATLSDVLHGTIVNESAKNVPNFSSSLFKLIVPNRSCKQAHIPEEYCPCYQELSLPIDHANVNEAAAKLLNHVNELLMAWQPPCAILKLSKIQEAKVFLPNQGTIIDEQRNKRIRLPAGGYYVNYRIVIQTTPGGALMEGIVNYYVDNDKFAVDGDVDRINTYGNTSYCVKDNKLKKYCFCEEGKMLNSK